MNKFSFFFKSKLEKIKINKIKYYPRNLVLVRDLLFKNLLVHNGKNFKKIFVNKIKLGYKLGEFSLTRKFKKFKIK